METLKITTARMTIYPLSDGEMAQKIAAESDDATRTAYGEMLAGCRENPQQRVWSAIWEMRQNGAGGRVVGDLCFKGFNGGAPEIGYGIKKEFAGHGLMSEAVAALAEWASRQPGVTRVLAQTEPDNLASQRVLVKAGFAADGTLGDEGPLFTYTRR